MRRRSRTLFQPFSASSRTETRMPAWEASRKEIVVRRSAMGQGSLSHAVHIALRAISFRRSPLSLAREGQ